LVWSISKFLHHVHNVSVNLKQIIYFKNTILFHQSEMPCKVLNPTKLISSFLRMTLLLLCGSSVSFESLYISQKGGHISTTVHVLRWRSLAPLHTESESLGEPRRYRKQNTLSRLFLNTFNLENYSIFLCLLPKNEQWYLFTYWASFELRVHLWLK
jgi:hypothetical protein